MAVTGSKDDSKNHTGFREAQFSYFSTFQKLETGTVVEEQGMRLQGQLQSGVVVGRWRGKGFCWCVFKMGKVRNVGMVAGKTQWNGTSTGERQERRGQPGHTLNQAGSNGISHKIARRPYLETGVFPSSTRSLWIQTQAVRPSR